MTDLAPHPPPSQATSRRSPYPRLPFLLLLAALALSVAGEVHRRVATDRGGLPSPEALRARLATAADRKDRLVTALQAAAEQVASLPAARTALSGDRPALAALFAALDTLAAGHDQSESLAVHSLPLSILAWTGRGAELRGLETISGHEHGVFVLAGSVTTTLVATSPVSEGGRVIGLASAAIPVKVRRNIRNQYLSDFDRIAGSEEGLEVSYVDARDDVPAPAAPTREAIEAALLAPGGRMIGLARASAVGGERGREARESRYRRGTSALACIALIAWMVSSPRPGLRARILLGILSLRLMVLVLGWPILPLSSALLSPDAYASTLLGPLLASPLDLLLTAACIFALSALVVERALALSPVAFRPARAMLGGLLALPLLAGTFVWVGDTCASSSLDLETITLLPRSGPHAVVQVALLLVMAAGFLLITSALSLGGPLPARRRARSVVLGGWLAFGLAAEALWPRTISLPLVPAIALVLLAGVAANHRGWLPRVRAAPAEGWAGLVLAVAGLLSLLLYPSLVHYGEKGVRLQIERDHAPLILRQPQWRAFVLSEAQRKVDTLGLLEESSNGTSPPGLEELAFATWSATDLAGLGFSSAVEIQDASGLVISRFALNFPTLDVAGPPRPLPADAGWKVARERLSLASAERAVLHARRRLVYSGESHGAVHLYLGDDAWNLPFVPGRDPYSLLFRSSSGTAHDRPVELLVYDAAGRIAFSSADRPPALAPEMADRVRRSPAGQWATMLLDGRLHHTFLFSDGQSSFGLAYPRVDAGRYLAGLVEAFAGLLLLALVFLLALVLVRTALGRESLTLRSLFAGVRRRFILRLFLAFVAAAIIPVAVLEVVVRRFVADRLLRESEDQALERASVARKAVEDFAFYQRGEAAGLQPVTDPALVWVSSLIRNDLDVFGRGRLLASSKRELYASGLLLPRVPGAVFRSLSLEQASSALRTERIGSFSTLVVSVPVKLAPGEAGILSIPFALRQRELQATLDDLDRNIRLASVAFLLFAAALAHSMSRRISGPIAGPHPGHAARGRRRPRGPGVLERAGRAARARRIVQSDGGRPGATAARPRAEQPTRRLGRDGAPGRPRGEEPADPDPALGGAPAARLRRPHRGFPRHPGYLHGHHPEAGGNPAPARHRVLGLRPAAGARPGSGGPGADRARRRRALSAGTAQGGASRPGNRRGPSAGQRRSAFVRASGPEPARECSPGRQ